MTTQVNLHALAERIEKATGAESSRALLRDALLPAFGLNQLWREDNSESDNRDAHFGDYLCDLWDAGGKLDAAVALCERALPGDIIDASNMLLRAMNIAVAEARGGKLSEWLPLALCIVVVRSKIAEQAND